MHPDEKAIRDVVALWMSATKAGDTATVLRLMTDDALFLVPGREPFGKAFFEAASESQKSAAIAFDGSAEVVDLQIVGDMAVLVSRLRVTMTPPGGSTMRRAGHTLTVLRKQGGSWRIARDANLLMPVETNGS